MRAGIMIYYNEHAIIMADDGEPVAHTNVGPRYERRATSADVTCVHVASSIKVDIASGNVLLKIRWAQSHQSCYYKQKERTPRQH